MWLSSTPVYINFIMVTIKLQWSVDVDWFAFFRYREEEKNHHVQIKLSVGGGLIGTLGTLFRNNDTTPEA